MPSSKGNLKEDKGDDNADVALQGRETALGCKTQLRVLPVRSERFDAVRGYVKFRTSTLRKNLFARTI